MPLIFTNRLQPWAARRQPHIGSRNTPSPFAKGHRIDSLPFESDSDFNPLDENEFVTTNDDDLHEYYVEQLLSHQPCMLHYSGDAAIPMTECELRMVAEAMAHWTALHIWNHSTQAHVGDISALLIDNTRKLHRILRLNTEMIAQGLWVFDIIYDNPQFVTQYQKGFPDSHTFRRELGDGTFEIFAAYVVSILVVLNAHENNIFTHTLYCADIMKIEKDGYGILAKLRSVAHFILQERRLTRINPEWSDWLEELKNSALKTSNIDIPIRGRTIVAFSFEIARSHHLQEHSTYDFCTQWLPRVLGIESDIEVTEMLHHATVTYERQQEVAKVSQDEAHGLAKWAALIIERNILCFEVCVFFNTKLMHVHNMFHLPTMHTAFTLWNFSRIWSQGRLKRTIYERFPDHDEERVIVFIYLWSAYMTTLILDDGPPMTPDSSLRLHLGAEFFSNCYNATLNDLNYRLHPRPKETLEWLENMVFWTKELEMFTEQFIITELSEGLERVQNGV